MSAADLLECVVEGMDLHVVNIVRYHAAMPLEVASAKQGLRKDASHVAWLITRDLD